MASLATAATALEVGKISGVPLVAVVGLGPLLPFDASAVSRASTEPGRPLGDI